MCRVCVGVRTCKHTHTAHRHCTQQQKYLWWYWRKGQKNVWKAILLYKPITHRSSCFSPLPPLFPSMFKIWRMVVVTMVLKFGTAHSPAFARDWHSLAVLWFSFPKQMLICWLHRERSALEHDFLCTFHPYSNTCMDRWFCPSARFPLFLWFICTGV